MTVAELLTFLIHADQSKEVYVEGFQVGGWSPILKASLDKEGDVVLEAN